MSNVFEKDRLAELMDERLPVVEDFRERLCSRNQSKVDGQSRVDRCSPRSWRSHF